MLKICVSVLVYFVPIAFFFTCLSECCSNERRRKGTICVYFLPMSTKALLVYHTLMVIYLTSANPLIVRKQEKFVPFIAISEKLITSLI